jgi:hypothetical protein
MSPRLRRLGGMDTGFPASDAQTDFSRARRERALARLTARLRREPSDFDVILPFEEVIAELGQAGQRSLGLQSIPLDSIVGTVDRSKEFDRRFRPTSGSVRGRWQRIAEAQRRGTDMPPISVYRVGDMHFVKDGHHRVSVARAQGRTHIDAYVTEVQTKIPADAGIRRGDLPLKGHERLFNERVPLPPEARSRVRPSDPWDYGSLAEGVEAWGFRTIQARGEFMSREEIAEAWYREDYLPVVNTLREAGLIDGRNETDVYMRVVSERYRLMRTHEWSEQILTELRPKLDSD